MALATSFAPWAKDMVQAVNTCAGSGTFGLVGIFTLLGDLGQPTTALRQSSVGQPALTWMYLNTASARQSNTSALAQMSSAIWLCFSLSTSSTQCMS